MHSAPPSAPLSKSASVWLWPTLATAAAAAVVCAAGAGWEVAFAAMLLFALVGLFVARKRRRHAVFFGRASQVTLARSGLVAVLAAALLQPELFHAQAWLMTALALAALVLDGVDGWVARFYGEVSDFGARFDMEVDAALIAVLCLAVLAAGKAGPWVLAIGLMRYAFVGAALFRPWLGASLPPSFRRKLVCVWQVAALLVCLSPLIGPAAAGPILASALMLLAVSFAIDLAWLHRQAAQADVHQEDS